MGYLEDNNWGISGTASDHQKPVKQLPRLTLPPRAPEEAFEEAAELLEVEPRPKWVDFWAFFQQIPLNQLARNMKQHGMSEQLVDTYITKLVSGEHGAGFSWSIFAEDSVFKEFFCKYLDEFAQLAGVYCDKKKRYSFSDLAVRYGRGKFPSRNLSDGALTFEQEGETELMLRLIHRMAHAFLESFTSYEVTHHVMDHTHELMLKKMEREDLGYTQTENGKHVNRQTY